MRFLCLVFCLLAATPAQSQAITDFSWLGGCWRSTIDGDDSIQVWDTPPVPAIMGYGMIRQNGEISEWAQMRIEMQSNGDLVLFMMPDGYGPYRYLWTQFRLPNSPGDRAYLDFENSQPRFPQKVHFEVQGDRMVQVYSSARGREERHEFQRAPCAASAGQ